MVTKRGMTKRGIALGRCLLRPFPFYSSSKKVKANELGLTNVDPAGGVSGYGAGSNGNGCGPNPDLGG